MTRRIMLIIPFLILIFQCIIDKNPLGTIDVIDDGKLSIWTVRESYLSSYKIDFIISNFTDSTAYFNFCLDNLIFTVEKEVTNGWKVADMAVICPYYNIKTIDLRPDQYISSKDCANLRISNNGIYRLKVYFSWIESSELDDSLYSNVFEVK